VCPFSFKTHCNSCLSNLASEFALYRLNKVTSP
jgi:hypothetical protein